MSKLINETIEILLRGGIIGFPTDTVYGIAADAGNVFAIEKLYSIKKRDEKKPLQIMVSSVAAAREIGDFSSQALLLAEKFWPGGLTIVVKKKGENGTIGIRIPSHPLALELLKSFARPLAATSANISGEASALNGEAAACSLPPGTIDLFLPGESGDNQGSTVVDMTGEIPVILRQGKVKI